MKKYLCLILIIAFTFGCSSDRQEDVNDDLPCIDVTKNYPEKEIILTDIADVTFLCLNSDNDDFLYGLQSMRHVAKNTIVIIDKRSGRIMFFSKDGTPKSLFNHKGQGPQEYTNVIGLMYDEDADEVFIVLYSRVIQVYSSTGEYKRKIILPKESGVSIDNHDNESLFLHDFSFLNIPGKKRGVEEENDYPVHSYNHPFVRISKIDGKVLDYVKVPFNETKLAAQMVYDDGTIDSVTIPYYSVINTKKGLLLSNPETDTIFLYDKNKNLTPVICKTPLVKDLDPMVVISFFLDYDEYQFFDICTVQHVMKLPRRFPIKPLARNKKTGEVFLQKITLPDYKGKEFLVGLGVSRIYEEGVFFELELTELKQAYIENRLSGKLKELVGTLDEYVDNNVFMLVDFK